MIFLVVSKSRLVGGLRTGQCNCSAMVKSSRLNGSAMLAMLAEWVAEVVSGSVGDRIG